MRQGGVREGSRWRSREVWGEPLSQEPCQSCVPNMCSADPDLEPFTKARTDGGVLLWKDLRSRHPPRCRVPLQNSPAGWHQSAVSLGHGDR